MTHVLARTILISAGTPLAAASALAERYTPHGVITIAHGKNASGEFVTDLEEAEAAGYVVRQDQVRAVSEDPVIAALQAQVQAWLDEIPGNIAKFHLTDAEAILGRLAAGGE